MAVSQESQCDVWRVSVLKIKRLWQLLLSLHRNLDTFQTGHDPEGGSEFRCGNAGFVRIPHGVLFAYSDLYIFRCIRMYLFKICVREVFKLSKRELAVISQIVASFVDTTMRLAVSRLCSMFMYVRLVVSVFVSREMLQRSSVDRRRRVSFGYPVRALPEGRPS